MRPALSLLFGIASSVGICVGGASVASYVMAEPDPNAVLHSREKPELWTVEPRRVDLSKQQYVRLPPLLSTYAEEQQQRNLSVADRDPNYLPSVPAQTIVENGSPSAGHAAWCSEKYRSYDPATDRYRSFSGEERPCISPASIGATPINAAQVPTATGQSENSLTCCKSRYASYRPEDNSYMAFSGRRMSCTPPAAGNALEQAAADE
jgi:hypothetical protein